LDAVNPKRMKVIARSSTMAYKRQTKSASRRTELGADYLLDGQRPPRAERVRVTVHLDPRSRRRAIWSENYDRFGSGVNPLQDELGNAIARQIQVELAPAGDRPSDNRPGCCRAYDPYLLGKHFFSAGYARLRFENDEYFEAAIAKDPSYALAFSGLAEAYTILPITSDVAPREVWPLASKGGCGSGAPEQQPRRGAGIGGVGQLLVGLGLGTLRPNGFGAAITQSEQCGCAWLLRALAIECRPALRRAVGNAIAETCPLSPIRIAMSGQSLLTRNDTRRRPRHYRRHSPSTPASGCPRDDGASSRNARGRFNDALVSIDKAYQFSGGNTMTTSFKAYVLARNGHRAEAERLVR